jgi:thioester reductase-like protein
MPSQGKRLVFVTGGTGFIGRRLLKKLLERKQTEVYLLVRRSSFQKVEQLIAWLAPEIPDAGKRVHPIAGDITKEGLVNDAKERAALQKKIHDIFHLAARYELGISKDDAMRANVDGTINVLNFARDCNRLRCLNYISTMAVAGDYKGVWQEDMLIEGQQHDNHYAYTKFLAEVEVRDVSDQLPVAIYRPGVVVGDSTTGEMDKIDGPYYLLVPFLKLQSLTQSLLPAIPIIFPVAPGGNRVKCHIVPVDYIVNCLDHISRKKGIEGVTFSLTDPKPTTMRQFIEIFCERAGWIKPFLDVRTDPLVWALRLPGIKQLAHSLETFTDVPVEMVHYTAYATTYDTTNTLNFLKGSGISCPPLKTYASKLLAYARKNFV